MKSSNTVLIALSVSLGGFLFGFDASVVSGVIGFVGPQFNLNTIQQGWVVSSPSFSAMFAMLLAGRLSDFLGRRTVLSYAAILYAVSALLSAIAPGYEILVIARMIGGVAFGTALVIGPMYIGEIAPASQRGKLVSIQQLNIVLGFSASYFSNYGLLTNMEALGLTEATIWRWMLAIELVPAVLCWLLLIRVPRSPRWLMAKGRDEEAIRVLRQIHGESLASEEAEEIKQNLEASKGQIKARIGELFVPSMRLIFFVALILALVQQVTGINSILFYAATIFEQSGVGRNAAFAQAALLGVTQVVFTVFTILLIDRIGRKVLLLGGLMGIAISMGLCTYGFANASFSLDEQQMSTLPQEIQDSRFPELIGRSFDSDLAFKAAVKDLIGEQLFAQNEGAIIAAAAEMDAVIILIGILGFMASFSLSVGPVMWVIFSEIFPARLKGIAIAFFGFINSFSSFLVQLVFPWELANLGNATSYALFGISALIGFGLLYRILPETKGKSLEELEAMLVKT